MWQPYVDIAHTYFPNAKFIINKYHFIRQVNWAIEKVRKRLQKSMILSLHKYYKRSHKLVAYLLFIQTPYRKKNM